MRHFAVCLMLIATSVAAWSQASRENMTKTTTTLPPPPVAEQRPYSFERHGVTVQDPYHWLKDQSYPTVDDEDVLSYLRAENAYFEAAMAPHRPLIETLFQEMRGRIPEDDSSVPVRDGDWLYWWAFQPGAQYRTWYRRPVAGGDAADGLRRAGRGRRASNISGWARWRSAPTAATPRPSSTTTARSASSSASAT